MKKLFITGLCLITLQVFSQGPFSMGTIQAGDSIIIYYTVSVNTPLVPSNAPSLTNQGSVTVNGGPVVLTDDPDTAPAGDATVTPLNSFPLPVTFGELRAYQKSSDIELAWKVLTETSTLKYEIEKSGDGRAFNKIGEVNARGGNDILYYTFLDSSPFAGSNFYRLKVTGLDGSFQFTGVVRVTVNGAGQAVALYPNPAGDKIINLELRNAKRGAYQFTVFGISGQQVFTTVIQHNGGSSSQLINLPASLGKGYYQVLIRGGTATFTKKLVLE